MASEQCAGQPIDVCVDVFSLGVIIHELVTGKRLFCGATTAAIMTAMLEGVPSLRDDVWLSVFQRLRTYTARMLESNRDARFADGNQVLAALRELASEMFRF